MFPLVAAIIFVKFVHGSPRAISEMDYDPTISYGAVTKCQPQGTFDKNWYGRLVEEKNRIAYVQFEDSRNGLPAPSFQKAQFLCSRQRDGNDASGRAVCSQDQLGAAFFLGYENPCRGYVSDVFADGHPVPSSLGSNARIGEHITALPYISGGGGHTSNQSRKIGLNAMFEKDAPVNGVFCCSKTQLNRGARRCNPQHGEMSSETMTALYVRYTELVRQSGGRPVLLGGSLIGALRNHSVFCECAEARHESGAMHDSPDIDVLDPKNVPGFDIAKYAVELKADPLFSKLGILPSMPELGIKIYCDDVGFMYPRILLPDKEARLSFYIEEWDYQYDSVTDSWREHGDSDGPGGFCENAFSKSNSGNMVDVSFGAIPAKANILTGSTALLDMVFGNWRTKVDKKKYSAGQGKNSSWSSFNLNKKRSAMLCKQLWPVA